MPSLTGPQFWTVTVFTSMFAQLTSFTMLLSLQNSFASLHTTLFKTHVVSKSGDNIGLVWSKIYTSKKCQFEDVTILHCTNASHALGHPCLVSLLLWHPLLFHTFLIRRIFLFTCSNYYPGKCITTVHCLWKSYRRYRQQGMCNRINTLVCRGPSNGLETMVLMGKN